MKAKTLMVLVVSSLMALCDVSPVFAQDKRADAMREQVRRMQQAQKKAEAERATLVQEKEGLVKDKAAAEDALKKAGSENAGIRRSLAAARQQHDAQKLEVESAKKESQSLAEKLADTQKRLAETEAVLRATQQKLAATETERGGLATTLGKQREATQSCEAKNIKLYEFGSELLDRYQSKGIWTTLVQKEPFTGIKSVEIENLLEEYRDKLAEQWVTSAGHSSSTR